MLTKDAKICLFTLYREYQARRSSGISRSKAIRFNNAATIQSALFPDAALEDVEENLRELSRNGFVSNFYSDNTILNCELTDFALIKMENQRKEVFLSIADFVSKFIP